MVSKGKASAWWGTGALRWTLRCSAFFTRESSASAFITGIEPGAELWDSNNSSSSAELWDRKTIPHFLM
jgi:hypothetical protein